MRRTKAAALETRAKILESALDIFSEKSFSNTSLTEIAANVGLTKGALYWHFRNKNDLLLQLMEEICNHVGDEVENLFNTHDSAGKLREYYKNSLAVLLENDRNKKIHKIMTKMDEWTEDIQQSVQRIIKDSIERERLMVEKFISKGQEECRFRKDISSVAVAVLISSIFHGLCMMQLSGLLPEEFPQYTDILFDAFAKELNAK
ncbi:MAG: TetR/AcrR family transcriptional regulator [Synergistaceae bacterium]|nr:TetR/AcrR family transcriptional regulator [Synergistaceae bacterium]